MPYYEFECTACGKKFTAKETFKEHDEQFMLIVDSATACQSPTSGINASAPSNVACKLL